jgi:rhamnose utilization protein RhaD (predicted bifunctional aldolase and dehydrogenase)
MGAARKKSRDIVVTAERLRFIESDTAFLTMTLARPLALADKANASITLGFVIDDKLRKVVRFWDDPAISSVDVSETCERCRLSPDECAVRAAPPVIYRKQQKQAKREEAVGKFLARMETR